MEASVSETDGKRYKSTKQMVNGELFGGVLPRLKGFSRTDSYKKRIFVVREEEKRLSSDI